ncbi:MAG: hypothetical protein JWL95_1, partial [Gemmatimonadetes bacterium]|nr:hypothetical protein [Gemmatimonadota bacterium]
MKKKRIRYSEFGATPAKSAEAPPLPAEVVTEIPAIPRPRRDSTPVELARALAAAQFVEAANAAKEAEEAAANDTSRPAPIPAPAKSDLADVLVFRIGLERFAVDLLAVEEVIDL